MFNTIVVGIDGSPYGKHALETAISLAKSFGSTLHLVGADHPVLGEDLQRARASLPPEFREAFDLHDDAHRHVDDAVFEAEHAGVPVARHDIVAHPADALLDVADDVDADLIVVGCRGRGFTKRHLLGSVSTRLAHHTHRSILIVHSEHEEPA